MKPAHSRMKQLIVTVCVTSPLVLVACLVALPGQNINDPCTLTSRELKQLLDNRNLQSYIDPRISFTYPAAFTITTIDEQISSHIPSRYDGEIRSPTQRKDAGEYLSVGLSDSQFGGQSPIYATVYLHRVTPFDSLRLDDTDANHSPGTIIRMEQGMAVVIRPSFSGRGVSRECYARLHHAADKLGRLLSAQLRII